MTPFGTHARGLALVLFVVSCVFCSCASRSTVLSSTTAPSNPPTTTPMSTTFEPYANTNPAVSPTGQSSVGKIRTPDGRTRSYRLYVPASLDTSTPAPLLVALHGGLGSSAQFEANSAFNGLAESNGFVVVYPDGIGAWPNGTGPQTWNGGYCCGPAARDDVDDVGFVRLVIDRLDRELSIDPARTFVTGHSNGAIMAYRLACELSDRVAAIGVQAGSLGVDTCAPARPVSVIHLHGTADTNHPIDGGTGSGLAGVVFRPARDAMDAFAVADSCSLTPVFATDPANPDLTVTTWASCADAAAVRYVVVQGASHAWMGHPAYSKLASSYVGEPYLDLDASRAIWSFLATHPRR
jgi:polyhydroxybutyrate depolymerase